MVHVGTPDELDLFNKHIIHSVFVFFTTELLGMEYWRGKIFLISNKAYGKKYHWNFPKSVDYCGPNTKSVN